MTYFPMFIDLKNKPVLVVGGGIVALRKLQKLAPYGPVPTVVAPDILAEIEALPQVKICRRAFDESDLELQPELVIAATDDVQLNCRISDLCQAKRIPVNVVDDPEKCTFIFPALVQQGDFSAGICTGGASPTAAIYYKEQLQKLLPENLDEILKELESKRQEIKNAIPDQAIRADLFRKMFENCLNDGFAYAWEDFGVKMSTCAERIPRKGSVALVGAGCGKADLITVRGLRLLQQCEAVVYDDLIDPELLEEVPKTAFKIYMGKRSGAHSATQREINQKLIDLAKQGLKVVRLKGGDPYLFGRGGEEMLALKTAGIPCQEVPGIPSAIGIPAEAGIPVTHRGASRGLHIVTAHTSDTEDHLPADFDALAKLEGTLVFLMGLQQLPRIAERLMAAGKSGDTPVAVLSGGNSLHPARVRAALSQIVQAVQEANVVSPAIIMVGDVAGLDLLESPLTGVRVGIIGTEEIAIKQQRALGKLGAEPIWILRSVVREVPFDLDLKKLADKKYWFVFTSVNGVRVFFERMKQENVDWTVFQNYKFAVIGAATGKALEEYGITPDLCPEVYTSEGLAKALISQAESTEEMILLRSAIGSPVLVQILAANGFSVRDISIYELETAAEDMTELPELDYLTFSSASGVELFFEKYSGIPKGVQPVCIGEVTAKALSKYTDEFFVAEDISVKGIVEKILAKMRK